MGRIKTSDIKKRAKDLIATEKGKFAGTFTENKGVLREMNFHETKRIRNKIAGYITKTVKRKA